MFLVLGSASLLLSRSTLLSFYVWSSPTKKSAAEKKGHWSGIDQWSTEKMNPAFPLPFPRVSSCLLPRIVSQALVLHHRLVLQHHPENPPSLLDPRCPRLHPFFHHPHRVLRFLRQSGLEIWVVAFLRSRPKISSSHGGWKKDREHHLRHLDHRGHSYG